MVNKIKAGCVAKTNAWIWKQCLVCDLFIFNLTIQISFFVSGIWDHIQTLFPFKGAIGRNYNHLFSFSQHLFHPNIPVQTNNIIHTNKNIELVWWIDCLSTLTNWNLVSCSVFSNTDNYFLIISARHVADKLAETKTFKGVNVYWIKNLGSQEGRDDLKSNFVTLPCKLRELQH